MNTKYQVILNSKNISFVLSTITTCKKNLCDELVLLTEKTKAIKPAEEQRVNFDEVVSVVSSIVSDYSCNLQNTKRTCVNQWQLADVFNGFCSSVLKHTGMSLKQVDVSTVSPLGNNTSGCWLSNDNVVMVSVPSPAVEGVLIFKLVPYVMFKDYSETDTYRNSLKKRIVNLGLLEDEVKSHVSELMSLPFLSVTIDVDLNK